MYITSMGGTLGFQNHFGARKRDSSIRDTFEVRMRFHPIINHAKHAFIGLFKRENLQVENMIA